MTVIDQLVLPLKFNRGRTLGMLDKIEQSPDPLAMLGWRPGPGRAHVGWQLMHIGVTEELFATERLWPDKPGQFQELWPRFRGGSQPDDVIPAPAEIRRVLQESREHLLDTLSRYSDDRLNEIPAGFKDRGFTLREILHLIAFHEAHHHGQAHITLNLYKAQA